MKADEPRQNRIPFMMSDAELKAVDDWRFANRIATRAEAVRRLIQLGLFASDAPQPSGTVKALADALRGLLKAYENAFDWTAELPPETAEAERIANEVLEALTSSKPEQVPSGWKLVPEEPTEEMYRAVYKVQDDCAIHNYGASPTFDDYWSAALSASPAPLRQEVGND